MTIWSFLETIFNLLPQFKKLINAFKEKKKNGDTLLLLALRKGWYIKIAKSLIWLRFGVNAKDKDGNTPLHFAIKKGNIEIVESLINKGADINAKDKDGNTPLHFAIKKGNTEIVKSLIEKGADINAKDKNGETSLHYAARYGHIDIFKNQIYKSNCNIKNLLP